MSDNPGHLPPKPAGVPTQANPAAARKSQFHARLENQKAQLERHGNFAEVVIRTTPEGTDMINFARLWEYVLVQADRQTRGYVAKSSRGDFELTRKDFEDCVDFMVQRLKSSVARHRIDLAGTNFISRVAQRYSIVEKSRRAPAAVAQASVAQASAPAAPIQASEEAEGVAPAITQAAEAKPKAARPQRVSTKAAPPAADDVDDI